MNSQAKIVILAIIAGFVILGVIYFIATKTAGNSSVNSGAVHVPAVGAASQLDQIKGNKESKIIIVEYSDFQCPACAAYYPIIKKLSEEFGDKIVFIYRHFPLSQHQNAEFAAVAAEAAGRQGKFWEMHDLIFDNQNEWSKSSKLSVKDIFIKYAGQLNLDTEKFKADFDLKEIKQKVANDLESGIRIQVRGTPTFFLNGEKLSNPENYEEFRQTIESAVNKQ